MKKSTAALLGACLLFGMSGAASASVITTGYTLGDGGYTSAVPGVLLDTFDNGSNFSLDWGAGNGVLTKGSTYGVAAAPGVMGNSDLSTYAAVTGSQMFYLPFLSNYLGLWWGSVDGYNVISFFKGGVATGDVINGSQISSPASGHWTDSATNLYVNATELLPFDSFELTSGSPSFEVDNVAVAPVPEPGTILLLGAGLFGIAIYGKRRQNSEE